MATLETKTIKVLETNSQNATLTATYNPHVQPNEMVFKYKLTGYNAMEWEKKYSEVEIIYAQREVSVKEESKNPNQGLFSIGNRKDWLYSHSLWKTPKALEDAIYDLLKFSLTGKK
jgi:hypothetical protein